MHTQQVDVLGSSMGGFIAQLLALESPDVVRKLALSGTGPSFGPDLERPMNEVQSTVFNPTPGIPTVEAFFPSFTTGDQGAAWFNRTQTLVPGSLERMASLTLLPLLLERN